MTRRVWWVIVALLLVAGGAFLLGRLKRSAEPTADSAPGTPKAEVISEVVEIETRELLFPGEGDRLYPELREMPVVGSLEQRIQAVVEALLAGPSTDGLRPPLPDGVKVRAVRFFATSGNVVLDLGRSEGEGPLATGSKREILAVYSLVNTVTTNFAEAESLQILWDGRQPVTFAGHLDTSRPLLPNPSLQVSAATP